MKSLWFAFIILLFAAGSVWAQDSPHPGTYTGSIKYTLTDFDQLKPTAHEAEIRLKLNSETTMSLEIEGLLDNQLAVKCRDYHGIGSAYLPFLVELFVITLPMHFDKKTGDKMTGAFIMTQISPGGSRVYEGKFKAEKGPNM